MKKNLFFGLAAVAIATVSCTNNEVIESAVTNADNAISFNTYAQGTRANNEVSNTSIKTDGNAFGVCGYTTVAQGTQGGADYIALGTRAMNKNTQIQYASNAWGYANASDVAFWPPVNTAFYAYYPYASSGVTYPDDITNTATDGEVISIPVDGTKDVLVAYKAQQGGVVTLPFTHVFAKIKQVNVKVVPSSMSVNITGVELCNSETTGAVSLKKNGTHTMTSADPKVARAFTFSTAKAVSSTTEGGVDLITKDDNAYIFPIASDALWNGVAGDANSKAASSKVCLKLTATVSLGANQIHNGAIYVPICGSSTDQSSAFALNAQKRYIFNISFKNGIGCDEDGKALLNTITFDTSVTEWADDVTVNITL